MQLIYQPAALKMLGKLDVVWQRRILGKMAEYAENPLTFGNMVKRLAGDGRLRLRIGDYRVLFTDDGMVISIEAVGHRSDVYRGLK